MIMYIEHTPLEHNLQELLRTHRNSSHIPSTHDRQILAQPGLRVPVYEDTRSENHEKTQKYTVGRELLNTTDPNRHAGYVTNDDDTEEYELVDVIDSDYNEEGNGINCIDTTTNSSKIFCSIEDNINGEITVAIEKESESASQGPPALEFVRQVPPLQKIVRSAEDRKRKKYRNTTTPPHRRFDVVVDDVEDEEEPLQQCSIYKEQFDSILNDFEEYQKHITRTLIQNTQMGIDLFNVLRKFLTVNNNREDTRKRRLDSSSDSPPTPSKIKYCRVDNRFPKILNRPLDDDAQAVNSFSAGQENKKVKHRFATQSRHNMNRQPSSKSNAPSATRKSIFSAPQRTNKLIKNTSYADVDYCDVDDVELINGDCERQFTQASSSGNRMYNNTQANAIGRNMWDNGRRLTYSEALRGGHVLGSMGSSGASTSGGWAANHQHNSMAANQRSIVSETKNALGRREYLHFLEQMAPCVYGPGKDKNMAAAGALYGPNIGVSKRQTNTSAALDHFGSNNTQQFTVPSTNTIILVDDDDDDEDNAVGGVLWQKNRSISRRPTISSNPAATSTARNTPLSGIRRYTSGVVKDTIIVDDDQRCNNDRTFAGILTNSTSVPNNKNTIDIEDSDDADMEVLSDIERSMQKKRSDFSMTNSRITKDREVEKTLPYVDPINSLRDRLSSSPHLKENWLERFRMRWDEKKTQRIQEVKDTEKIVQELAKERRTAEIEAQQRLQNLVLFDRNIVVIDDFPEPVEEEEPEFKEFTEQQLKQIQAAINGQQDQVLVSKFNLNITRRDIHTFLNLNWLNDEVINFYMNLITERSEKNGLPKVYAMNTFFIPRLMQAGHSGVKRWTRKVDIFSMDIIPVPVHVGGVHWCMAIIHLQNRTIKYYDSMGSANPNVLRALEQYLRDESLDKRKQEFDTSGFQVESVANVPRQLNGSDCGVFSCMFAEYITRNKEITFTQENMPYFRNKMILEIVQGELLN